MLFSTTTSAYSLPEEHYEVLLFHLVLCENKASYFNCHFRLLDQLWKWKSFSYSSLQKQLIIIHFTKLVFLQYSLYWVTQIIIYSHWNFSKSSLSTSSIMIVVFVSYFLQVWYLPFCCSYSVYIFSNNIIIINCIIFLWIHVSWTMILYQTHNGMSLCLKNAWMKSVSPFLWK